MKSSHQELEDLKTESERKTRSPTSLLARAIRYLSYREYSRFELRRKLLPFAQSEDELEGVIERLLKKDLLSNERFTENLVLRKAARYGARRIAQELGQHQIASETIVQELKQLQDSEESRAYVVWEHKFGEISSDPKEQARQMRFLAQRGFGHELIMRIIKGKSRSSSS